jgi:hypothetical protein
MKCVGPAGLNAFLDGLDNKGYGDWWWDNGWKYDNDWITGDKSDDPGLASVHLSPEAIYYCNYYGIYPSPYQMATRALPSWIRDTYHLPSAHITYIFNPVGNWIPGAVFRHVVSNRNEGSFLALGLTRSPDIRLTALGLLCAFKPRLYRSEYTASGTSRLVILQLGQVGGV